jgi:DNA-binding NarL/FixJ family response regulator
MIRVVVAEDDGFTRSLVTGGLEGRGFEVLSASTAHEGWDLVGTAEPHVLVSDLDFGDGASGVHLINRVHQSYPWVGLVVLTAHRDPALAVERPHRLPATAVYLVKSTLQSIDELVGAIDSAIAGSGAQPSGGEEEPEVFVLTRSQAEVLRMLAGGASTRALAEHRGTTVRAAEAMLTRLYVALGLEAGELSNPRVEAVRLWQQGRVTIR